MAASPDVSGENVNYAVKSSYLLSFLESVPEVSAKLKEPNTKERKFEDVVKSAEQAAVLVLVYWKRKPRNQEGRRRFPAHGFMASLFEVGGPVGGVGGGLLIS